MTVFQLLMLGVSAYFAFKIYEHIQTLQEPEQMRDSNYKRDESDEKNMNTFSPFSPEALVEKADNSFEKGDYTKALAFLTEADAKDSNNPDIIFKIAYILQKNGDDEEALKYYKEVLELDKNNEFAHNSIASIYRKNGELISAKMHLNASVDIDSQNPITYYNYGNLLVDMQHNEEAIEMYKKALEINPDFKEAKQELETLKK